MRRLEQALLSLPIYADHLKFLRFRWNSLLYEFSIVLPFGLASSPRVFTNLVQPTIAYFTRIIHTYYYFLRHIAVFGNFVADCSQNVSTVIKVLEEIYGVSCNY